MRARHPGAEIQRRLRTVGKCEVGFPSPRPADGRDQYLIAGLQVEKGKSGPVRRSYIGRFEMEIAAGREVLVQRREILSVGRAAPGVMDNAIAGRGGGRQ